MSRLWRLWPAALNTYRRRSLALSLDSPKPKRGRASLCPRTPYVGWSFVSVWRRPFAYGVRRQAKRDGALAFAWGCSGLYRPAGVGFRFWVADVLSTNRKLHTLISKRLGISGLWSQCEPKRFGPYKHVAPLALMARSAKHISRRSLALSLDSPKPKRGRASLCPRTPYVGWSFVSVWRRPFAYGVRRQAKARRRFGFCVGMLGLVPPRWGWISFLGCRRAINIVAPLALMARSAEHISTANSRAFSERAHSASGRMGFQIISNLRYLRFQIGPLFLA